MGFHWKQGLLVAGLLCLVSAGIAQDDPAPAEQPGPQPGDDVAREAEPQQPIDGTKTEALALYMQGVEAEQNNKLEDALKAYEQAAAADPAAPDPVRARAVLLLRMGEVDKGIETAREALELDPNDFKTRFQLATVLMRRQPVTQNIPEAIRLMDEALTSERLSQTDPEFILIHSVRGRILLQLRQNAKAAESYAVLLKALEAPEDFGLDFRRHKALMDDRLTGYEAVGEAMLSVGRTDEAVRAFEALARIRQDEPGRHHFLLATALFRADDAEGAEANLEIYFESGRREQPALELLKQVYASTSRSSQLIEKLKSLTSETPDETTVMLYLAEIEMQQGLVDDAVSTLKSVIVESGDPAAYPGLIRIDILRADAESLVGTLQKSLRARVQLGEILPFLSEIANEPEFAQRIVDTCLQKVDEDSGLFPEVTLVGALIAQEIDASEDYGKLLQATLDLNPNQRIGQNVLQQLGMHKLRNSQFGEAANAFRRLLSIRSLPQRSRVQALTNLAKAESLGDHYDQALETLQLAFQLQPDDPEVYYWQGWVHLNEDQTDAARESLNTSIRIATERQISPTVQEARLLLARVLSRVQDWDECIHQYKQVLAGAEDDEPMRRRARLMLSAVLVESGDNLEAEKVLEELYAEIPDDPGVNNDLGYLYADHGKKLEQALEMIELAVEAEPDNRAYLDSLGWVLYRLERHEEALEALKKANNDPEFKDATLQEHLGDVYKALDRNEEAVEMWRKALATEEESDHPKPEVLERLRERVGGSDVDSESKPKAQEAPETTPAS